MRIAKLEAWTVRVPYKREETSSLINRSGITEVIVKLTTDDGHVGWGECTRAADTRGVASAIEAMRPLVEGRDPWDKEAIHRDLAIHALWAFQPMTGNFAYAGIDMALWDLCGKASGQPLYRMLGGAMRERAEYFYYLEWSSAKEISRQAKDGRKKGYSVYYLKGGIDTRREEEMLEALRDSIGPEGRIRIDINQAWSGPQAVQLLTRWHARFDIDFCEGPVRIDPLENMLDLKRQVRAPLCVNEGLWREADAWGSSRAGAPIISASAPIGWARLRASTCSPGPLISKVGRSSNTRMVSWGLPPPHVTTLCLASLTRPTAISRRRSSCPTTF